MFCDNCGKEIKDGSAFCEFCGASLAAKPDQEETAKGIPKAEEKEAELTGEKVADSIYLCADGKYRWVYEFDMLRNPTILFTTWKVIGLSFLIVMLFNALINLIDGSFRYNSAADMIGFYRGFLLLLIFMLALGVVAYLILAGIYGWKYMVLFTMDEDGIEHRQMAKQFEKSQAIGWLTAAVGALSGNIGRVGTGILAATRTASTTMFPAVRTVKSSRWNHTIYVNQRLNHNQVYAEGADFDFVREYIIRHCVNAKRVS